MTLARVGGALQSFKGEAVFRGFGLAVTKSAALSFVSVQPPAFLKSEVVLLGAGAGAVPSKQFALLPNPTRSRMLLPEGQETASGVMFETNATLAAVALKLIDPLASGVGRLAPTGFALAP